MKTVMKSFIRVVLAVKTFAALVFTGLICLYMFTGYFCALVLHQPFAFNIPFIFVLQGLLLSILIAALWAVLMGEGMAARLRYLPRLILFSAALTALLAACLLTFTAVPTAWAKLWLTVAGCITAGVIILAVAAEVYYKSTGQRYTEILNEKKKNLASGGDEARLEGGY